MTNISVNRVENNDGMSYDTLIPVKMGEIGGKSMHVCNAKDVYLCVGASRRFTTWIAGRIEEYGFVEGQDFELSKVSPRSGRNSAGGRPALEYTISSNMAKELAMVERTEKGRAIRNYFIACEEALHRLSPSFAADLLRKVLSPEQQHALSDSVHSKVACLDKARQRSGYSELWSNLKARHQVAQYRDIPQGEFEEALRFVESYVWEGEFLLKQTEAMIEVGRCQAMEIHRLVHSLTWVAHYWRNGIGQAVESLNSEVFGACNEHLRDAEREGRSLDARLLPKVVEVFSATLPANFGWGVRPGALRAAA